MEKGSESLKGIRNTQIRGGRNSRLNTTGKNENSWLQTYRCAVLKSPYIVKLIITNIDITDVLLGQRARVTLTHPVGT